MARRPKRLPAARVPAARRPARLPRGPARRRRRGLAAIVHPWESGLDDSPAWDEPLAAVELPRGGVAHYERRDRLHVDPDERPSDAAYDRFVHLMRAYQDDGYADDRLADRSAFLVEDPLFNAIWLWSTHALAEIAERIGEDPGPYREAAAGLARRAALAAVGRGARALPPARPSRRPAGGPAHGALARAAARPGPAGRGRARRGRPARVAALPQRVRGSASRPPTSSERTSTAGATGAGRYGRT